MKKTLKRIMSFAVCAALSLCVTGCKDKNKDAAVSFSLPDGMENTASGTVAENDRFELLWDSENYQVQLVEKSSGRIWCNTPDAALTNDYRVSGKKNHPKLESPILVTYYDKTNFNENTIVSKTACLNKDNVSAEKTENGISVTYYFEMNELSVTVDYTLREDSMLASIDTSKITCGANSFVEKVSLAPYFCGITNESKDSYLLVPSGSGSLVYPTVSASEPTVVSEPVYGKDIADLLFAEPTTSQSVRLPVYGAKQGDKSTLAVIEEGAEYADITVSKNDSNVGFTTVYADFTVRGYTKIEVPRNFVSSMEYMKLYSEPINTTMSVGFYPLKGKDADYNGMAAKYREYLSKEKGMTETKLEVMPLNIKFAGGVLLDAHFLGIHYKRLQPVTTLEQVQEFCGRLDGKYKFSAGLYGYGKSGLDTGKPAGGLGVSGKLGGVGGLKRLNSYCAKSGIPLYMNFELLKFNNSGSGISTTFDSAEKTNGRRSLAYLADFVTANFKEDLKPDYLVSRSKLDALSSKLLGKVQKWGITGVGLDTLSSLKYSDYSEEKYYFSGDYENQSSGIIKSFKKADIAFFADSANACAAVEADSISDTPISSSKYDIYDCDIPFYQMVFSGLKNLYTPSVNTSANEATAVLKAVEGGCGLSYTVGEEFDNTLLSANYKSFYGTSGDYVSGEIDRVMSEGFSDYSKAALGQKIVKHTLINKYVRSTRYENGITVYVNYSDADYVTGKITVPKNGYIMIKGGEINNE